MSVVEPGIPDPVVVGPDEGRRLEMGPNSVKFKLEGDDVFSVIEYTAGPGWRPPYQGLGRHTRETSAVYVLDGELTYRFEDREIKAPAGTLVHLPKGAWFSWRNDGTKPARFLVIFVPAGFEQMFADLMTGLDADADADAIAAAVAAQHTAYGMERHH